MWALANKDSYREIANLFGLEKSTINHIIHEMCKILTNCRNDFIKWSNEETKAATKRYANRFPNTIGFIDGCHIQIKAPRNNPVDFYNRKETHNVILQGVCDHTLKFIHIYVGQTGRAHDARVFRESSLSLSIEDLIDPNDHLLGDSAYTLLKNVMTPYRDTGHLTQEQRSYNTVHAQYRSCIERTFGRLKGKFRRLKYLELHNIRQAPTIICAACVLHNFILIHEPCHNYADNAGHFPEQLNLENLNAVQKRDRICWHINN